MAADNTQGPLQLGGKFLKYTIRGLLGRGGHAWVYDGHDEFLDFDVAIKILHRPGGVTRDMLRRGQAEAKLLYRLKHENIVDVLDAGMTEEGLLYIVMELLRGDTLRELLAKKGRLALVDALALFAKISDGVEAAHEFKAIHRDLKPENIFVLDGYEPKVLDFGIAKVVDAAGWTTDKDIVHGTVLYMSPEQLNGEKATARSDVYALGLTMFEALYGRHPLLLKNQRPTISELTWMQHAMRPPRLDQLDKGIPRYVARLVEWMLFKAPDRRVASMRECGKAIRECMARFTSQDSGVEFASVALRTDAPSGPNAANLPNAPDAASAVVHDTERIAVSFATDDSVTIPRASKALATSGKTDRLEQRRATATEPAPAMTPGTVPPVTTGVVPAAMRRSARLADEPYRQLMLRLLVASSIVGAALGGGYVVLTGRSASHADPGGIETAEVTNVALPADAPPGPAAPAKLEVPPPPPPAGSVAALTAAPDLAPLTGSVHRERTHDAAAVLPPRAPVPAAPPAGTMTQRSTALPATLKSRAPAKRDDDLWVAPTSRLEGPIGPAPMPDKRKEGKPAPKPHSVDITTPILE